MDQYKYDCISMLTSPYTLKNNNTEKSTILQTYSGE
jgi:hypothetical protein